MRWLNARDEREVGIDASADRFAYLVVSYGLLGLVAYRGLVEHAASWDLLALVILAGFAGLAYRIGRRAGSRRGAIALVATVFFAAVVAGGLALTRS